MLFIKPSAESVWQEIILMQHFGKVGPERMKLDLRLDLRTKEIGS